MTSDFVSESAELLKRGELVAIPTETVYGLAAIISSDSALKKIFAVKERPFFDPLIVHVQNLEQARQVALAISVEEQSLIETFWPGPLTLVFPKQKSISSLITSGLDSVAVRAPSHKLTQELLRQVGEPLAAPSANKFGRVSPTAAAHVKSELPGVHVLDGGPCLSGLESTVVRVNLNQKCLEIFRPGAVTLEMLSNHVKNWGGGWRVELATSPVAPGQLQHHYQPTIPLIVTDQWPLPPDIAKHFEQKFNIHNLSKVQKMELSKEPELAARQLYSEFRTLAEAGASGLVLMRTSDRENNLWTALWNRAEKAASAIFMRGEIKWK